MEPAVIKAVVAVEAKGEGFLPDGRMKILFEAHKFHKYTGGKYTATHPHISSPTWNPKLYLGGPAEWDRLTEAKALDQTAALMSASYGAFQILGANHKKCGFDTVEEFVEAISESEFKQLKAFLAFVKSEGLDGPLKVRNWKRFARGYNGPAYAAHGYHVKLAEAYRKQSEIK